MAKMNYSNFQEDECEIIPAEAVEVLPKSSAYDLSGRKYGNNGQALANAVSPVAAIVDCINTLLDTTSTISKCITVVSVEKQKTAQVNAAMRAKIEESIQQTERVKVHEKEETKRLKISCKSDIEAKKLKLEKLRIEYQNKNNERRMTHEEYNKALDMLEKQVDDIMKDKDRIRQIMVQEDNSANQIEIYLQGLNDTNAKLVELSEKIVSLRRM